MDNRKRFVWHDLMSTDVEGSKRFYGELFGWQLKKEEKGPYTLILSGGKDIGGVLPFDKAGIPSHWIGYVSVDDVADVVAKIKTGGGQVHHGPADIPGIGTFAVAVDPQGGLFAPFKYTGREMPETDGPPPPWTFCWDELMVPDPDAAARFYGAVVGWETEVMSMPGFGNYILFKRPGVTGPKANAAGLMSLPPGVPHPFWMTYVAVLDTDATLEKAKRLGATPTSPPMDIPGVGRFASMLDPQRAPIAILASVT